MIVDLETAMIAAWDADESSAIAARQLFTGGIWVGRAPENTRFPYIEITSLGKPSSGRGSSYTRKQPGVRMMVYYKADGHRDPLSYLRTLAAAVHAVFDDPTLSTTYGSVLRLVCENEDWVELEQDVLQWFLDYRALTSQASDYGS